VLKNVIDHTLTKLLLIVDVKQFYIYGAHFIFSRSLTLIKKKFCTNM